MGRRPFVALALEPSALSVGIDVDLKKIRKMRSAYLRNTYDVIQVLIHCVFLSLLYSDTSGLLGNAFPLGAQVALRY